MPTTATAIVDASAPLAVLATATSAVVHGHNLQPATAALLTQTI